MWPFTKRKSLIIKELDATIFRLKDDLNVVMLQRDDFKNMVETLTSQLAYSNTVIANLNKAVADKLAAVEAFELMNNALNEELSERDNMIAKHDMEVINLREHIEVLNSNYTTLQERYDIDTHNLLIRIAELEPKTMDKAEAEAKPQLVQVTDDFFGKLAAELATQWTKTTQHSGNAHGKVSDRLTSMQQFAQTPTQSINSVASTKVTEAQSVSAAPKPAKEYIPSPDFLASFDEGTTQVNGEAVATGISITQPATGPIKLPSQMAAEFELPYNPDSKHYPL